MPSYFEGTPGLLVSEDDIRRLLLCHQASTRLNLRWLKKIYLSGLTIGLLIALAYGLLNAPALFEKTQFAVQNQLGSNQVNQSRAVPNLPVPGQTLAPVAVAIKKTDLANNHLMISRIHVDVPINWDVASDDNSVLNALQTGVAQLAGTAHPNERGNVFVVGHSSYFPWRKGSYKHVFALLPQLTIGDAITVIYQNQAFTYQVTEIKTVSPDDTSVLESDGTPKLSLMTCVPLGTRLKRLVVVAEPKNTNASALLSAPHTQNQISHLPGTQ